MKVIVKSVASISSPAPMTSIAMARAAQRVVGKTVELTVEPLQKVGDLAAAAQAAFAFDAGIVITKAVCEHPEALDDAKTIIESGIRDGDMVNCRFHIVI